MVKIKYIIIAAIIIAGIVTVRHVVQTEERKIRSTFKEQEIAFLPE